MLNKTKFQNLFSEMIKINLPFASLCVFWGLISSFWAFFVTTVTTGTYFALWNKPPKTHKDAKGKLVLFISLKKC